jgi:hypothetical protein
MEFFNRTAVPETALPLLSRTTPRTVLPNAGAAINMTQRTKRHAKEFGNVRIQTPHFALYVCGRYPEWTRSLLSG